MLYNSHNHSGLERESESNYLNIYKAIYNLSNPMRKPIVHFLTYVVKVIFYTAKVFSIHPCNRMDKTLINDIRLLKLYKCLLENNI